MADKLKYDRECIHCQLYPMCKGKPLDAKECLKFVERSKEDEIHTTRV